LIFVFSGAKDYWEDDTFVDPKAMNHERLAGLLSNPAAAYDGSWLSFAREKREMFTRVATSSAVALGCATVVPLMLLKLCWSCCRELRRDDDPQGAALGDKKKD